MAVEGIVNLFPEDLVSQVSFLIKLFQAIGGLIIFYIVFNIVNVIINRKKKNELKEINKSLVEIKKLLAKHK